MHEPRVHKLLSGLDRLREKLSTLMVLPRQHEGLPYGKVTPYLQEVHELPPALHLLQLPEQPVSMG